MRKITWELGMCGDGLTHVPGGDCVGPMWQGHTHSLVVCPLTASYSRACLWGVLGSGLGQHHKECLNGADAIATAHSTIASSRSLAGHPPPRQLLPEGLTQGLEDCSSPRGTRLA